LAWPEPAPALSRGGPSQSRHSRLGPGSARPKPRLLAVHFITKVALSKNINKKTWYRNKMKYNPVEGPDND
jgi:hypothetical protein